MWFLKAQDVEPIDPEKFAKDLIVEFPCLSKKDSGYSYLLSSMYTKNADLKKID